MPQQKGIPQDVLDDIAYDNSEEATVSPLSDEIGKIESSGKYDSINKNSSAVGKHQFLWNTWGDQIKKVTGVSNKDEFRKDPTAQEKFFNYYEQNVLPDAVEKLKEYNKDGYSETQLKKLYHFKGEQGAQDWLTKKVDKTSDNNLPIDQYVGKPEANNETIPADVLADIQGDDQGAPQKKSPSESGLGENLPNGPGGFSQVPGANATDLITGIPVMQAPQSSPSQILPQPLPATDPPVVISPKDAPTKPQDWNNTSPAILATAQPVGISVGVNGHVDIPINQKPIQLPKSPEEVKGETASASHYLAQDILNNAGDLPKEYADNINSVQFDQPGNIVHDITDPHGDPATTAGYMATRLAQMSKDHTQAQAIAKQKMATDPNPDPSLLADVQGAYFKDVNDFKNNANHIIDLQLANRAYQDKNFDATKLGIERQKLMGDKKAIQDEVNYNNGRPIDPNSKFAYQSIGLNLLQKGKENTAANEQDAVAEQFAEHSDHPEERLKKDNPQVVHNHTVQILANQIFKDENPLHGTLFSRESISQDEMEDAAKKAGLSKKDIVDITPDEIPRSAGLLNQFTQGMINTAGAPLYETGMRALAGIGIANKQAIDDRFHPRWENDGGFGSAFTGQVPQAQRELSIENPRGVLGSMANGAGSLFGFLAGGEAGGNILQATGITRNLAKANKIANFATAALPSYNDAYQRSATVIGDSPEDEGKRQLYSTLNGIIGGAVMMIDPKADVARDVLGETQAGKDVIKAIKKNDISALANPEFKDKIAQVLHETGNHLGLQVTMPVAQTAASNVTDMIFDPKDQHHVMDNLGQAAINGGVAMFLPSLAAGLHAPGGQSALNKALLWEVGTNPDQYRKQVIALYKDGQFTKEQFDQANANIDKTNSIVRNQTPLTNIVDGKPLTEEQRQQYAWSLLQKDDLEKKLAQVTTSGDDAQIKLINEQIKNTDAIRSDILKKAGKSEAIKKPVFTPPQEESKEAPDAQGSVATDAKSAIQDYATKLEKEYKDLSKLPGENKEAYDKHIENLKTHPEETVNEELSYYKSRMQEENDQDSPRPTTLKEIQSHIDELQPIADKIAQEKNKPENKKEDISLTSEVQSQSKTNGHENENTESGQENGARKTSAKDSRANAQVEGSAENGRVQGQEESITPEASDNEKAGATTEPALTVSGKKKRRALVVDEDPALQTIDGGVSKGQPEAKTEEALKEGMLHHPEQPVDALLTDNPTGEKPADFTKRISDAVEGYIKPESEGGLKDNALLVTHSNVIKQLEAAYNPKTQSFDFEHPKHPEKVDIQSTEVGNLYEYKVKQPDGTVKTLHVARHGETEANEQDLQRDDNDKLTQVGKDDAVDVANKLKGKGITPSQIISSDLPRAKETADIISKEFAKQKTKESEWQPPQPPKPLHEMTGDELSEYHDKLKEYNKNLEKNILGDKYEEWRQAQAITNSMMASDEAREKANKKIGEIEDSLSEELQNKLYSIGEKTGNIADEEEVKPYRDKVQLMESAENEQELGKDIANSLIELNKAPSDVSKMSESQKHAFAGVNAVKRIIEERGWDGKKVTEIALMHAANKFSDKNDAEFMLSKYLDFAKNNQQTTPENEIKTIEPPKETPQPNGAIATEDVETENADASNRLKEIDEELLKQHASQKVSAQKRQLAEKANDVAEANRHNDNWYKKQDRIDRLEEEKSALQSRMEKDEREANIKKSYNDFADKLESKYAANKKKNEGAALSSILGISPKIADHVADFVVARTIEGIRELGNIHVAIDRAIRLAKEKFGAEAKELTAENNSAIHEHLTSLGQKNPVTKQEPVLPIDHEEYAKDILADIKSGTISHEDAIKEVRNEVIVNREGKPVSDHVQENNKAKILNYIDYHVQKDITSIRNDTTRLRRIQLGLDEEIPAAKKEFGQTWEEAKDKIENNPQTAANLIEELSQKARPLTDVENAILLHHQNAKEIEILGLNNKINEAAEKGDRATVLENKVAKSRVLDELQQIYDINKAVGTENARGLASRRMMVNRKYDLVNMLAEKRATANDGAPLSDEQEKEIEDLHKKITETQKAFDDYIKQSESQIIDLQRKALAGKIKDKKTVTARLRAFADKIENASKNQAYSSPIPITPKMVADGIRLIADGIDKGEQVIDLVKKAIGKISKDNPGVDEQQVEKEINKAVIEAGILEPTPERKKAEDMGGLFAGGKLDREALRLKVEADRAKAQYEIKIKQDKQKDQSNWLKAQNWWIKWQRAFKLSNPLTMGKLAMAGFTRLTTTPLEDIVGGAYSAILPQLAKGAIGEGGGLNINETAKAYKYGIVRGMKDASEIMSKGSQGKSEMDILFGKAGDLPPEAIEFFGQLHSATKAPIKRAIFERSLERRLRRSITFGIDVTDPMVQTSIMTDAYKDANRAIFMQDNKVAEGYQKMVQHFDKVDPKTGKAPGKWIGSTLQWMVPFVKVPTNIAAEIGTHIYGVPVAGAKLLHAAFTKGIENIPADEKEIILRQLKKGSLGAAALALGYFNPQNFGGFYQPGQKRREDDAEAMGLKLFGEKLPSWMIEAPIFQAMQIGATIRRVKDEKVKGEEKGITEGMMAGAAGLINDVPLISQPARIAQLLDPKERKYYLGELAKSTIDPALLTYLAKVTDPADQGNPIRKALEPENKRKSPKTIAEHIKSGLPFLREELPEKYPNKSIEEMKAELENNR